MSLFEDGVHHEITLDPDIHEYYVGGRKVHSVTQVLDSGGYIKSTKWGNDYAMERGRAVHLLCHLHDVGMGKDPDKIADEYRPYRDAYLEFLSSTGLKVVQSEKMRYCPTLGFCGTPDKEGHVQGVPTIVDLKTGEVQAWAALQTAGYAILASSAALPDDHPAYRLPEILKLARAVRRYGVQLRPDGRPRVTVFDDAGDIQHFASVVLGAYQWKKKHNIPVEEVSNGGSVQAGLVL